MLAQGKWIDMAKTWKSCKEPLDVGASMGGEWPRALTIMDAAKGSLQERREGFAARSQAVSTGDGENVNPDEQNGGSKELLDALNADTKDQLRSTHELADIPEDEFDVFSDGGELPTLDDDEDENKKKQRTLKDVLLSPDVPDEQFVATHKFMNHHVTVTMSTDGHKRYTKQQVQPICFCFSHISLVVSEGCHSRERLSEGTP